MTTLKPYRRQATLPVCMTTPFCLSRSHVKTKLSSFSPPLRRLSSTRRSHCAIRLRFTTCPRSHNSSWIDTTPILCASMAVEFPSRAGMYSIRHTARDSGARAGTNGGTGRYMHWSLNNIPEPHSPSLLSKRKNTSGQKRCSGTSIKIRKANGWDTKQSLTTYKLTEKQMISRHTRMR